MSDMPVLDQPQAYVVVGPDDQRGPYTLELLISEVVSGRLSDATPVWWPGLADWTTMAAHPAIAGEIYRRRNPAPSPDPAAFAPPVAAPPQPQAPEPGYQQAQSGYQVSSTPGQDYSTSMYGAEPTAAVTAQDQDQDQDQDQSDVPVGSAMPADTFGVGTQAPTAAEESEDSRPTAQTADAPSEADGDTGATGDDEGYIEVPAVDITPADFAAVDQSAGTAPDGFRSSGPAEGLDPVHAEAFSEVIARSRARADAAAIVAEVDKTIAECVESAALAIGMKEFDHADGGESHEFSFRDVDLSAYELVVSRVTGHAMAVRDGHVELHVKCTSAHYHGGDSAESTEHGEIRVVTDPWGGAAFGELSLMLPLSEYVDSSMEVDRASLDRDLQAVLAAMRHRMG